MTHEDRQRPPRARAAATARRLRLVWPSKFFKGDGAADLIHVALMFAAFVIADRLTISLASLPPARLFSPTLFLQAPAENRLASILLLLGACVLAALGRRRLFDGWDALDHGTVLRTIGSGVAIWLAWRTSSYEFNYVLGQWHAMDRGLVMVLAAATFARPIFVLPLVAQIRLVNGQFSYPLGTDFGQNADEMMVLVLVALGVTHLLYVATGRRTTSSVLLMWSTIVAAHFFEPGRGKLALDWLGQNDISYLPFNSYTAGWRGQGDGQYARSIGSLMATFGWPAKLGTLALELGALVAVAHVRLLRVWLPMCAGFHGVVFAITGFFFFDWLVFEGALWMIITLPSLRHWVEENSTRRRGLVAMAAVLVGGTLYHPPRLAWLDAPVGYGYEVAATGRSGLEYAVPLSALAPFEQDLTFARAEFTPLRRATAGYGAISSLERLAELRRLRSIGDLTTLEAGFAPLAVYPDSLSERLITSFFRHASAEQHAPRFLLHAPSRFWSGRGATGFNWGEPITELRVVLLASLVVDGDQQFRRTPVLTLGLDADGLPTVTARANLPGL